MRWIGLVLFVSCNTLAQAQSNSPASFSERIIPDAIVRIPGTELNLPVDLPNALKVTPQEVKISRDYSEDIKGDGTAAVKWVVVNSNLKGGPAKLENPEALIPASAPPVSLEAVIVYSKSGTQAKISQFRPSSVAAWKYLSTALTNSSDLPRAVDGKGKEVETAVRDYLKEPTEQQQKKVVSSYMDFEGSISKLAANTKDEIIARGLGNLSKAVTAEKGVWQQVQAPKSPTTNTTKPNAHPDESLDITKASASASSSLVMRYLGQEASQRWQGIIVSKSQYQSGRASVAILEGAATDDLEAGSKSAFASGSIIGNNLVLTCAHEVTEVDDPSNLAVRFGPDFPEDYESPGMTIPARLIYSGKTPKLEGEDPLDFALLEMQPRPDQVQPLRNMNLKPIRLTTTLPRVNDRFFLLGYPAEKSRVISPNAVVCYPHIISKQTRDSLITQLSSQKYVGVTSDQLAELFNKSYNRFGTGDNITYKYVLNSPGDPLDHLPIIGAICSTVRGQSGGPACEIQSGDQFGVFVGGTDPEKVLAPVEPGWLTHEKILPITAIIEHLNRNFRFKNEHSEEVLWSTYYGVSIYKK